jgi:hypothetical protein
LLLSPYLEFEDQLLNTPVLRGLQNFIITNDGPMAFLANGTLEMFDLNSKSWKFHSQMPPMFISYSCMASSLQQQVVAIGNLTGEVAIVSVRNEFEPLVCPVFSCKVMNLFVHAIHPKLLYVVACDQENKVVLLQINLVDLSYQVECHYVALEETIHDIQILNSNLFVATRSGGIYILPISPSDSIGSLSSILHFSGAQGEQAVTSICFTHTDPKLIEFVSTGRDGNLVHWELQVSDSPLPIASDHVELDESVIQAQQSAFLEEQKRIRGDHIPKHIANQVDRVERKLKTNQKAVSAKYNSQYYTLTKKHKERLTRGWLEKVYYL